ACFGSDVADAAARSKGNDLAAALTGLIEAGQRLFRVTAVAAGDEEGAWAGPERQLVATDHSDGCARLAIAERLEEVAGDGGATHARHDDVVDVAVVCRKSEVAHGLPGFAELLREVAVAFIGAFGVQGGPQGGVFELDHGVSLAGDLVWLQPRAGAKPGATA